MEEEGKEGGRMLILMVWDYWRKRGMKGRKGRYRRKPWKEERREKEGRRNLKQWWGKLSGKRSGCQGRVQIPG